MSLTAFIDKQTSLGQTIIAAYGVATTDATGQPGQSGTATAGNDTVTAVADTSSFAVNDIVWIAGATSKYDHRIKSISANVSVRMEDPYIPTSEAVTLSKLTFIWLPFKPNKIVWTNKATGQRDAWQAGMGLAYTNETLRTTGAGVTSVMPGGGIVVLPNGFAVSPEIAPVSGSFLFEAFA